MPEMPERNHGLSISCAFHKKEEIQQKMNEFLQWVKKNPPPKDKDLPMKREKLKAVRKILQGIIVYHMEREPKSLRFLNQNYS
jgi:DNA repair protein RecO (recombination protein O)